MNSKLFQGENAEVKIAKSFTFEMAHALKEHEGLCRNLHGHSYKLVVTLAGTPAVTPGRPGNGMVLDFAVLSALVKRHILEEFDHSAVIAESDLDRFGQLAEITKLKIVPFTPTCELLLLHFCSIIAARLPQYVRLHTARLYETRTSYAEWTACETG